MESVLKVENLQKTYGQYVALSDINFEIRPSTIVGLLGKNGAGKTTLIKTILGLFRKYEGKIIYKGKLIEHSNPMVMNSIGSLVDVSFFDDLSAYDNLRLLMMITPGKEKRKYRNEISDLLELVGLKDHMNDKVKSFSFGMKQRLALAQAFMPRADLLILDEPFVGLDPIGIEIVKEKIVSLCKESGTSVIFSSHQLAEVAELSEEIIAISSGKMIYSGTYDSLVESNKKYKIVLNTEFANEEEMKGMLITGENPNEVLIDYQKQNLNQCMKQILQFGYVIKDIQILENPLIALFKE